MRPEIVNSPRRFAAICRLLFVMACSTAILACATTQPVTNVESPAEESRTAAYSEMEKLTEAILYVKTRYVDEKTYEDIIEGALRGMLQSLDKHSAYLAPEEYEEVQQNTAGKYGGIGAVVSMKEDGILTIISPIEDTPAFQAGLMPQDKIVEIDGESTIGLSLVDAVKKLRGPPGTEVNISIRRPGETDLRAIRLVREVVEAASVKGARMLEEGIAYIRVTHFAAPTAASFVEALQHVADQGMTCLVLDLRGNPGGLLRAAHGVAETLLSPGDMIVWTKGRHDGDCLEFRAGGDVHYTNMLVAVLINEGTASGSEIVAGALQDHKRAFLVGEKSFGKGSVQTILPLNTSAGAAIRLTTAKYYTPSKRVIHGNGIEPDILVPVPMEEWQQVRQRQAHIEQPDSYTEEEKAEYKDVVDRQLQRAVDVLKGIRKFQSAE